MQTNIFTTAKAYLTTYFTPLEELAFQSGVPKEQILIWVGHECMPTASYELIHGTTLRSSTCTEVWPYLQEIELFFPKSFLQIIKELAGLSLERSLFSLAVYQKETFQHRFEEEFQKLPLAKEAFPSLFDGQGVLHLGEFETFIEEIYENWLKGTYGVWIRNSHVPQQIAQSEIVQNFLRLFTKDGKKQTYTSLQKKQILQALTCYEGFSMPLGPHDHPTNGQRHLLENVKQTLMVSS